MSELLADLPLFPLSTVLFPGGLLPLKIFEARYVDMVRACLRDEKPFGVCMLHGGSEVAQPNVSASPESVGCLAEILSCDVEQYGLMTIRTRGLQRFRLAEWYTQQDGLLIGHAMLIQADSPNASSEHLVQLAACAEVLERIINTFADRDPENLPFLEPFDLTDAAWVSNRLGEILPIPIRARQKLMEIEDAAARLDIVHHYMLQHGML
jgi:Lon protease-like protein